MDDSFSPDDETVEAPPGERAGGRIAQYRLLARIGEGGFGSVFEADQEHPVRRRVALKLIKVGMDTHQVIARFEAERQALAMMDHPHIARVLDAGATETGRPFFVMELVRGEPLTTYCDRNNLPIADRLQLFEQVCSAVQHAHSKGIIHRDLKPSNVLVSTEGDVPFAKVIDFGIAKATSARLTDRTLLTVQHQMIGTPLYMSPEQAEGNTDIDTRSDIYSLGVILYELLTGTTPFESSSINAVPIAEIQRIIREVDPPRPSIRLSQQTETLAAIASHRHSDSGKLPRIVRGELDWIVMKAIEKDRKRRYETASALSVDIRRYLGGQPIVAAPPSVTYRLRKFVARHTASVAAGSLLALSLIVGIAGFGWQAHIAGKRAAELEQVSRFQADMLSQVDVTQAGKTLTQDVIAKFDAALRKRGIADSERAKQRDAFAALWSQVNATDASRDLIDHTILRPAAAAIDKQFAGQPLVDAALRQVLADLYSKMGLGDAAMPLQKRALDIRLASLGPQHPDTLVSLLRMGRVLQHAGKPAAAEPYFRQVLEKRKRVLGPEHPDTIASLVALGTALNEQGKLAEAEPYYRESLEKRRRVLGPEHSDTLSSLNNMGYLLDDLGKNAEAEAAYREALDTERRVLGSDNPITLITLSNLGVLLFKERKFAEAEPYYRESLERSRHVLGEEHPDTLISIKLMGTLLMKEKKFSEAESYVREALDKRRRILGENNPATLKSHIAMGELLQAQGKVDAAESEYRAALAKLRRMGETLPDTLIAARLLGALLVDQGRAAEAAQLLDSFEAATRKAFIGDNAYSVGQLLLASGRAQMALGRFALGEKRLLEANAILVKIRGPEDDDSRGSQRALAELYTAWNRAEPKGRYAAEAKAWAARSTKAIVKGGSHPG
jgi:serine/threonine protein kinase/tetratricopeptide (TPR) repeat protein